MLNLPLNLGLGDLGSVRGRRVLLQEPGNYLEVLLGPGQHETLYNVVDAALGVASTNLTPEDTKSRGDLSVSVTATQTMTDCEFRRLATILLSVEDEEA